MSLPVIVVEMGGGVDIVNQTLDGLPGDHLAEHVGGDRYRVISTDPGFLRFALEQQGYGRVVDDA